MKIEDMWCFEAMQEESARRKLPLWNALRQVFREKYTQRNMFRECRGSLDFDSQKHGSESVPKIMGLSPNLSSPGVPQIVEPKTPRVHQFLQFWIGIDWVVIPRYEGLQLHGCVIFCQ